jgi:SAM-dependent methyltransferase
MKTPFEFAALDDAAFVDATFRLFLRRGPEERVCEELTDRLREGSLSRAALIRDIASSEEFERLREIDDAVAAALSRPPARPDDEFVDDSYRLLLRRAPDPESRETVLHALGTHATSRAALLAGVVASEEYGRLFRLDDGITRALAYGRTGGRLRELTGPPGSDERVVEIPWVLSRYRGTRRVLDVGYANAEPAYVAALMSLASELLVGVDLAEVEVPGMTTVVADVRALPFDDDAFDTVFCISTLEHVGQDNSVYGVDSEPGRGSFTDALRELRRVVARGGGILLTVPCGRVEQHGWFAQLEAADWRRLFDHAGLLIAEEETYVLGSEGWRAGDPSGVRYGERGPGAYAVLCVELRRRR